jgi:glycosyltransferase involved in cell wall biosynthesis
VVITYFNYLWDINGISAGSAIKAKEFLRAMDRLGHKTYLEWRVPQPTSQVGVSEKVRKELKPALQKYLREPNRLLQNAKHLWQEYFILKRQKPEILFSRLEFYNFSGLWLSQWLGLPFIVEADCPPTYEYRNYAEPGELHLGNLSTRIELANLRGADAVIVLSNILRDYYIERGIPAEKMHVIPNGADPERFQVLPKDTEIVRRYDLSGKIVIGWIGALFGWSGIENLIRMAQHLLATRPDVSFLLVGGGKSKEFFEQHLHVNGYANRVILPGTIPHEEVPRYLSCMDVVLAPYPKRDFWYPSSMKLFEYMSAGKAVVATRVGQVAEIVQDGVNGCLFDPEQGDELMQKVQTLIDSAALRRRLGEQARRDVEQTWNWQSQAKKMIEIFEDILKRRRD